MIPEKVIDFHTHIFPNKIAASSIQFLEGKSGLKAFLNGTVEDLVKSSTEAGVATSIILPVVTNPKQEDSILRFANQLNESKNPLLFSFGGIHPDEPDIRGVLKRVSSLGMKGIKIHPQYQEVPFRDIRYKRIVDCASELGLIVVTHAGIDVGYRNDPCLCTPAMAKEVIREVHPEHLVLAHTGGWKLWDEVEHLLAGKEKCFFDLAFSAEYMDQEQLMRIIKTHGANQILFATDSPWSSQQQTIKRIMDLPLSQEEKNQIFYQNAEKLLK